MRDKSTALARRTHRQKSPDDIANGRSLVRSSQSGYRDCPVISSRLAKVRLMSGVTASHEADQEPNGCPPLGMTDEMGLILLGPSPVLVLFHVVCE
jgi:hypothetical protein